MITQQLADLLTKGVVPLYDTAVWWIKELVTQGLRPTLMTDMGIVLKLATALFDALAAFANAWQVLVSSLDCVGTACRVQESLGSRGCCGFIIRVGWPCGAAAQRAPLRPARGTRQACLSHSNVGRAPDGPAPASGLSLPARCLETEQTGGSSRRSP